MPDVYVSEIDFGDGIVRKLKASGGSGSGDMLAATYDPNGDVATAGGIAEYVDDAIDTAITSALTASY